MSATLSELVDRLRNDQSHITQSEEATKQGAVLAVLARIGWDRDDVREVVPEYSVGNGRVDYCLKARNQAAVFIEVKRAGEELDRHQEQLLDYAFRSGVRLAVLTNGIVWWLYLPLSGGSTWEQRRFFAIDLCQQQNSEVTCHFEMFLARTAIVEGSAFTHAEEIHAGRERVRRIGETLPKAWRELCNPPDTLLVDLVSDKVESLCGYRPTAEVVVDFLRSPRESVAQPQSYRLRQQGKPQPRPERILDGDGEYTSRKPAAFTFLGVRTEVRTWKDVLIGVCSELHSRNPREFDRVLELHGRKRSYFSRTRKEMTEPRAIGTSGIFAETNLSAGDIVRRIHDALRLLGIRQSDLKIETIRA